MSDDYDRSAGPGEWALASCDRAAYVVCEDREGATTRVCLPHGEELQRGVKGLRWVALVDQEG